MTATAASVVVVCPPVVDDDVVASSKEVEGKEEGSRTQGRRQLRRWEKVEGGEKTGGIPFYPPHRRRRCNDRCVRSRITIVPSLLFAVTTTSMAVGGGHGWWGGTTLSSPSQSCVSDDVDPQIVY